MEKQNKVPNDALTSFIAEGTCQAIVERYTSLADQLVSLDLGALDEDVVVIDTETTGFSVNHDELIQIAAARMKRGVIEEWYISFVNPNKQIPEEIEHLTGITQADVDDAPNADEAVAELAAFVGTSDLVAHNADFDYSFITKYTNGAPLLNNTWIDSLDIARIALPRLKSHRLLDLARAFGAPVSTHRADADVEALCTVYRILLAAAASMPRPMLEYIASLAEVAEWPSVKVFKLLAELPELATPEAAKRERVAGENGEPANSSTTASSSPAGATEAQTSLDLGAKLSQPRKPIPFNLKAMRYERVASLPHKPRVDADIIAGDPNRSLVFPTTEEVNAAFTADGLVGSLYDEYETRTEQADMAEVVNRAFTTSTNLAVEAGTGVGKSMAYLVPAALTARKNNITIGIATKTNALLDQLIYKELPLLSHALQTSEARTVSTVNSESNGESLSASSPTSPNEVTTSTSDTVQTPSVAAASDATPTSSIASAEAAADPSSSAPAFQTPLEYVALKGFSHYPCLRMVNRLVQDEPHNKMLGGKMVLQAPALATLLSFIEQSEYDDIDTLKLDYRILPRYLITTTSHECLRRKCPFFGAQCFVHGARRRAEAADIVVTNHSLLFCDIAADGGLLPSIRYWVVDEAHGAESEARRSLSLGLSAEEIIRFTRKVASDEPSQNVFIRAERRAGNALDNVSLFYGLTTKARAAGRAFEEAGEEFLRHIKDLAFFDTNRRGRNYEFVELWLNDDIRSSETFKSLVSYGRVFHEKTEKLTRASQDVVAILENTDEAAEVQREIASVTMNLKELLNAIETILFDAPPTYAYSATLSRKQDRLVEKLEGLLVNVGDRLNETLFAETHSVVFASATLTVADSFDSFETALGLNETEASSAITCQLPSSYDFDSNMTVYVVDDIPEPNESGYLKAMENLLTVVHQAQQGSMLTLFTNRKEMEKCYDGVQPVLKTDGLRLICQKWGVSAKGLRDDFLTDEHLSLFALKSFWEGFDAPGATLKGVIIPKLPFAKPSDPLSCERALRDPKAWTNYVLPAAVLETKQAAGRLIRKADDTGCLIIADRRVLTKGYGKAFLRSMPSKTIKVLSTAQIAQELAERYRDDTV